MPLDPGTRLGPYEIVAPIGAGGMGEVYRARDTRLDRAVAVKILPAALASDAEALARFEREARAVAALSHPNILAIHDFGSERGIAYSVTEMLEGESLARKIGGSPLPARKAIDYALQAARGLAAAHDRGIVHRDLKPDNLFVTDDGRLKILDFGLAARVSPLADGGHTATPTIEAITRPGTMMGTIGYMSPEQVRGLEVDHRTDIFSFGAILHEMLAGKRAFHRETPADTLSAILKEDSPDLPEGLPAGLQGLVRHCLEKNPVERFQSARDLAFHLQSIGSGSFSGIAPASATTAAGPREPAATAKHRSPVPVAAALLAGGIFGAALGLWLADRPIASPPTLRYLSYTGTDFEPSGSADGRFIVYTSTREGGDRIWLRQEPGGDEIALTSGPDDSRPRVSPDGTQVLFVRGLDAPSIHRIPSLGGQSRKIVDGASEADWSPDGRRIVFLQRQGGAEAADFTVSVSDATGEGVREIARVKTFRLGFPRWSPDGTTIAALSADAENSPNTILLLDAEGKAKARTLVPPPPAGTITGLSWVGSTPTIVYGKSETLATRSVGGGASRIVRQDVTTGRAETLMWIPSFGSVVDILGDGRLLMDAVVFRQNFHESPLGPAPAGAATAGRWITRGNSTDRQPAYSPDGESIIFSSNRSGNLDLWTVSTTTGAIHRITEDAADDWDPGFTPDGKQIVWSSSRGGHFEVWICGADGAGARQLTQDGYDAENPTATRDGAWVIYNSSNPEKSGIWKIHPDGTGAQRIVAGSWSTPEVSPDGAFVSFRNADPRNRVVRVARVADGELAHHPIAASGNTAHAQAGRTRWLPDGKRLAFTASGADGTLSVYTQEVSMTEDTSATRARLTAALPDSVIESFGISPDGKKLVSAVVEEMNSLLLAEGVPGIAPPGRARR